jgi:hypothetical protein
MLRAFVLENYAKGLILHKYPDEKAPLCRLVVGNGKLVSIGA